MEETIYQIHLTTPAIKQIYQTICFHLDHWPGGDPVEQQYYVYLRDSLQRVLLEETFMLDA